MTVSGEVINGRGRAGGYYGVPTANLMLSEAPNLAPGVYAGKMTLTNGEVLLAVICYGAIKDANGPVFEAHALDWSGDLYSQTINVDVLDKVSELVPFVGEEQMKKKILDDVNKVRIYFN